MVRSYHLKDYDFPVMTPWFGSVLPNGDSKAIRALQSISDYVDEYIIQPDCSRQQSKADAFDGET